MVEIQFDLPKKKRYSTKVMDYEMKFGCSEGMMKAINAHVSKYENSFADYARKLVMNNLNIDEHGNRK